MPRRPRIDIFTTTTTTITAAVLVSVFTMSGCLEEVDDPTLGQTGQATLVEVGREICIKTGDNGTDSTLHLHFWEAPTSTTFGKTFGCAIDGIDENTTECCTLMYTGNDTSENEVSQYSYYEVTDGLFMIRNSTGDDAKIRRVSIQDDVGSSDWTVYDKWDCDLYGSDNSEYCSGGGFNYWNNFKIGDSNRRHWNFVVSFGNSSTRGLDTYSAVDFLDNDEVIYHGNFHGYGESDIYPYALAWDSAINGTTSMEYLTASTNNPLSEAEQTSSAVIGGTVIMPSTLDSGAVTLFEMGGTGYGVNLVLRDGNTLELYVAGHGFDNDLAGKGAVSVTPGGTYSFIIEVDITDGNIALYWANFADKTQINARERVVTVAALTANQWCGDNQIGLGEVNGNAAGNVGGDFSGTFSGYVHIFKSLDL